MYRYRVVSIPEEVSGKVRASLRSPRYGHPAHVEIASGFGPCRSCLRTFREGQENRILFTYNTFYGTDITPLPGPVFIHQNSCPRYAATSLPPDLNNLDLLLEGYNDEGSVIALRNPDIGKVEESIFTLLSNVSILFIHIRNAKAGCFVARIERDLNTA